MNKIIFTSEKQFTEWFGSENIAGKTGLTLAVQLGRYRRAVKSGKRIKLNNCKYAVMSRGKSDLWLIAL